MIIISSIFNIIQMAIVFLIFKNNELLSGAGLKAFMLILFVIPIINLTAVFLYRKKTAPQSPPEDEPKTIVKRVYLRVLYRTENRPILQIKKHKFDAIDISEGGIRFSNEAKIELPGQIKGKTILECGEKIVFTGKVRREENGETSIVFNKRIPYATIYMEQQFLKTI